MPRPRTGTAYEKNGKWYIGVRLRDGRKWATPCPPRDDGIAIDQIHARSVAANLQRDYDHGRWDPEVAAPKEKVSVPTVTRVVTVLDEARAWIKTQTYSTIRDDRLRIERYLAPSALGAMAMVEVRPRHVLAFVTGLRELTSRRGGTLAPRSIRNIYSVVHRLFAQAVVAETITASPCHLPRRAIPSPTDKDPAARAGWVFRREEAEALMFDARLLPDRRLLYAILFLTGARFGEVAALRFGDWERDREPLGRIQIARSIERVSRQVKGTKTGVARQVPVHPLLAELLHAWREHGWAELFGKAPTDDDILIPNRRGATRNVCADSQSLKRDCATLEIKYRSLHKTRRTLISLALDDGARGEVFEWITHDASKRSMRNQYTTLSWATLCAEMAKVRLGRPKRG
jgi:integrase